MVPSRITFSVHTKKHRKNGSGRISDISDFVDGVKSVRTAFIVDFLENGVVHGKKSFCIVRLKLHFELIEG